MPGVVDADTHIIEHPEMWELFDPEMYQRRPVLASTTEDSVYGENNQVWLIDGMAVPKRFGKGSALVAVGGSDRENARTDIAASVRYVTDPVGTGTGHGQARGGHGGSVPYLAARLPGGRRSPWRWRSAGPTTGIWPRRGRWPGTGCVGSRCRRCVTWMPRCGRSRPPATTAQSGCSSAGVEGDRSLAESYFFPVYEAANRLGMAVCIHTGAGAPEITRVFDRNFSHNLPSRALAAAVRLPGSRGPQDTGALPGGAFRLHRGLGLLGALRPAPPAKGQRRPPQRRRRRRRQPRLGT